MKKRGHIIYILVVLASSLFAQRGKDGAGNITTANSIVNIYTAVTASVNAGATSVSVGSTAGYAVGDLIMIIQMQGASVNASKNFPWIDPTMCIPNDTSVGYITNYNTCGNYEFAQINSILSATSMSFDCALKKGYSDVGKTQVIRVPRYTTLTISGAGFISCPAWNGSTGGVAVVETETNATLSSIPSFSVTGKGFRGGGVENSSTLSGANKFGSLNPVEGAYKGESIAGDTNDYKNWSAVFCRGAIANGGGGGTAHNAGGGGGANGGLVSAYRAYGNPTAGFNAAWNLESAGFATFTSSGGGRGGYSFSSSNQNPLTFGPGSGGWSGDGRRNMGGFGGRPLDYSTGRLFLGGGGGSGDSNDNYGTPAGNGGGMVFMLVYGNLTGAGTILADGSNGGNTITSGGCTGRDGAGGGGGGGTVILNVIGTTNLTASPAIFARGGAGGNQNFGTPCLNTEAYGPGAGGGGGYIGCSGTMPVTAVTGGTNGIVSGNSGLIRTNFPPNGATMGGSGSTAAITPANTVIATPAVTICVNTAATLTATTNASPSTILWYNAIAGGSPIGTGSPYTTSVYTTPGTYTLFAGYCDGGTYRVPTVITVITGPTLTVNSPSVCSGQTATLTAGGANTYTWSTSATGSVITVNPATTTVYTVSGTIATCSAAVTSTVTILSAPTLTVSNSTICAGQTATLIAGGVSSYTWSTGATTSSINVIPATTTVYTVTGGIGTCTTSQTSTVTISASPTVTANSATICPGQSATLTANGATSYTWNTGATTPTISANPATTTNYTVTGSNGTCTNSVTTSITVAANLVVTATSATICSGAVATLTASGASTYTWSTTQTTTTINVNPTTTTIYNVTGGSGGCTGSGTATVVVNPNPTVSINASSNAICAGETATLTASGANSYTWNPGGFTSASINVSPVVSVDYTVTGATLSGCKASATSSVVVNTTPTLAVTSATICPGQTATLTANGAVTYTWLPGGTTGGSFTDSPATNSTYTVIGANATCTASATASINIGSSISITINQPTICAGQSATLTATSPATSYTWNTGANTSSIVVNPASTSVYSVVGTSGSCSASGTTTVTINTPPILIITGGGTICAGQTATLTANGANTYTWYPGAITINPILVTPISNTTYTVSGSDLIGCKSTETVDVSVGTFGSINVTATPTTVCSGETVTLTANGAAPSYTWLPGNAVANTITVTPLTTQDFTVVSNNSGCFSSGVITITVSAPPTIIITPSSAPLVCTGSSVTLVASGTNSYTWNPGGLTGSTVAVSPTVTTTYTLLGGTGACTATAIQQVTVTSGINFTVTPTNMLVCAGTRTVITSNGAQNYVWLPGNFTGSTITINPTASTIYSVTGSVGSCLATKTVSVKVSKVQADFAIVNDGGDNFSTLQFQNLSSGQTVNHWYFNNGTDTYASDPGVYFGEPGTYVACLYVKNNQGCADTLCKAVTVGCADNAVFIPNTFTPNENNINDVFKVVTLPQCITKFKMYIFNSWGQKIYYSEKFEEGWDGTFKGDIVPEGVYAYRVEYIMDSGKSVVRAGHVTVIK